MAKRHGNMSPNPSTPGDVPESQGDKGGTDDLTAERIAELVASDGYTRSVSVGLKDSEIGLLDEIAEAEGVARNAVMRFMLRREIALYRLGKLKLPVEETKTKRLRM